MIIRPSQVISRKRNLTAVRSNRRCPETSERARDRQEGRKNGKTGNQSKIKQSFPPPLKHL